MTEVLDQNPDAIGVEYGETRIIETSDGRDVAVDVSGAPDGHTVFFFHGSPGSRIGPKPRHEILQETGIRLICYDRPGYGRSDPKPGRLPINTVDDMQSIVEHMGIDTEFSIVSRSGGGPHALACALALPGVKNVATLASPAPPYLLGKAQQQGLGHANTQEFETIKEGREAVRTRVTERKDPEILLETIRPDFADDDARVVRGKFRKDLLLSFVQASRNGPEGWVDDSLGNNDWGFDPREISGVPILAWYGGQDPFVPRGNGDWLVENIGAQQYFVPEASHFRTNLAVPAALGWCATGNFTAITAA